MSNEILIHSAIIEVGVSPNCFICGGSPVLRHLLRIRIFNKEDAQPIINTFPSGIAYVDKRQSNTGHIQVCIGCCGNHLGHLDNLLNEINFDKKISSEKIARSMSIKPSY